MELFLPIHKLLKLTQEDIDNLNRVIRSEKTELVIKTLPTKKSPHPDGFTAKIQQIYKKELILVIHKFFQKAEEEGILLNSFQEAYITLMLKPEEDITIKENYRPINIMHKNANILKNTRKSN